MRFFRESLNLLWQGLRLCALRAPQFSSRTVSSACIATILALLCTVLIGADWLSLESGPRGFLGSGFFGLGLLLAPLGIVAWICSRRLHNLYPDVFGQVFLQACVTLIYFVCAGLLLDWLTTYWPAANRRHTQLVWALRLVFFVVISAFIARTLTLGDWLSGSLSKYASLAVDRKSVV